VSYQCIQDKLNGVTSILDNSSADKVWFSEVLKDLMAGNFYSLKLNFCRGKLSKTIIAIIKELGDCQLANYLNDLNSIFRDKFSCQVYPTLMLTLLAIAFTLSIVALYFVHRIIFPSNKQSARKRNVRFRLRNEKVCNK